MVRTLDTSNVDDLHRSLWGYSAFSGTPAKPASMFSSMPEDPSIYANPGHDLIDYSLAQFGLGDLELVADTTSPAQSPSAHDPTLAGGFHELRSLIFSSPPMDASFPVAVTSAPSASLRAPTSLASALPASLAPSLPTSLPASLVSALPATIAVTLPSALPTTLPASLSTTLPTSLAATLPTTLPIDLAFRPASPILSAPALPYSPPTTPSSAMLSTLAAADKPIVDATAASGVLAPYDEQIGFHRLVSFARRRLGKWEQARLFYALAQFRPSSMARQAPLSVQDLILAEQCIQRTLKDYENLLFLTGTPTVIWRTAGEIVMVGEEFTELTGWSASALILGMTPNKAPVASVPPSQHNNMLITEIMDGKSCIDYWEMFSKNAQLGASADSPVSGRCILLRPDGQPLPCAYCVTIKRDLFDRPALMVGNFLPMMCKP
ncbi:uncharacterized protein BJ171DRAFT_501878 [Polychytrium aggregatum]|uniref:uncharacterized protein n=1 Tax=Polychytrium aggregatum TaxID=110093 RepID=UPI0022FE73BF|nr:uncharacterized protein BJ171DRAFT_501878 [Polychytrium aggregatum]KAI9205374.1 hypothetical protein BJ171DRAFT_501878 [Polychytrium aggregatum]